jgi:ParB/RepB/Spo0J family partition protein
MAKEQLLSLAPSAIYADTAWNARHGDWTKNTIQTSENGNETDSGWEPFALSIATEGVQDPVEVRANPKGKDGGTGPNAPWQLIAGFRRHKAATLANLATIPAMVKDFDDKQARLRNIEENTARDDLKGADLAWGIGELVKQGGVDAVVLADAEGKDAGFSEILFYALK